MSGPSSRNPRAPLLATIPASEALPRAAGDLIAGRYEILAPLGRGGMGVVYRARDHELEEVVALKVLHRDLVELAETLARFRKEVKLARRVTHRNVARTFDIGEHEGERFLTMELIEGEPLADLLVRSGALEITRALEIARQMAEGMAAAHDAGVVHRDLKPENVSIATDGRVVLMDFGIARASVVDDALQTSGQTWGTPAYMAPEQVEARSDIDARADIYAFGAVLYEMLTGALAWSGASAYVVATARLGAPPPDPRALRPELSPELAALVMRCMARDKTERFDSARALLGSLDDAEAALAVAAHAARAAAAVAVGDRGASPVAETPGETQSDPLEARQGADGFRADIARQLVLMAAASPSYRRVLQELDALLDSDAGGEVEAAFERVWQKRSFEGPFERPLLFLAALRADARVEGASHPLYAAIAAPEPNARAVSAGALRAAVDAGRIGFWITLRSRRVQTNEVARSLAWLWPATLAGAAGRARPVVLFDIGASAGLNLAAEAVDVAWRRSTGSPLAIARDLDIRGRTGFDPRPLDVRRTEDCEWLRACVWPEQLDRFTRLEAAIAAFRVAAPAPQLVLARASSVPARIEDETRRRRGTLAIAYQSFVRGYIPTQERDAYEEGMRAWLAAGPRGERMWATLELVETGRPELSCALDVSVATGGDVEVVRLGRTSYHPQTIDVAEGAEERLAALSR